MPTRAKTALTKRAIDALEPEPQRDYTVWDADTTGFGIRVKPSGVKSFVVKYRNARGVQRKSSLGKYGHITLEKARKKAKTELGKVADGVDPAHERNLERSAQTVTELCDEYLKDAKAGNVLHRGRAKKPSTLAIDEGRIERHIKPLLGSKRIEELGRQDIETFMHEVRDGKTAVDVKTKKRGRARVRGGSGTAKKAVTLLSAMYGYAIRRNLAEHNPCQYVEKPADNKRERFLSPDEYKRLGKAIRKVKTSGKHRSACDAVITLALSGCRRGEILTLRRSAIDTAGKCLRFDDTKTGAQLRPCGHSALEHLRHAAKRHKSDWVFPANDIADPIINIRTPMLAFVKTAKLVGVTPHVLRHSYATVAHELGYSELTIAGLLGHSAGSVTSRYAHHVDHVLSAAADEVSKTIAARLGI